MSAGAEATTVGGSLPSNTQFGGGLTYRRKSHKAQRGGQVESDMERITKLKKKGNKADDVICMIYHDPGPLINQFTIRRLPCGSNEAKEYAKS